MTPRFRRHICLIALAGWMAVPTDLRAQPEPRGVVVESVLAGSIGDKAGLRPGDVILDYGGRPIYSPATLLAVEQNTLGRVDIALRVLRGADPFVVTAAPGRLRLQVRASLSPPLLDLYEQGRMARADKRNVDALARWRSAAERARDDGERDAAAWLFGRVGEVQEELRQWQQAYDAHETALTLLAAGHDLAHRSRLLNALGRCRQSLNGFEQAKEWYERASKVDADAGYEMWVAADAIDLGNLALLRGDLTNAEVQYARSLAIRERLAPDSEDVASSVNNLGIIAYRRGDLERAEQLYLRAVAIRERLNPVSLAMANHLGNLGLIAQDRSNLASAEAYFRRSLAIREQLSAESLLVADALVWIGSLMRMRTDVTAAVEYQTRALHIRERLAPDSLAVADSLDHLGHLARDQGNPLARDYYIRSLKIRERVVPDSIYVAMSLEGLGLAAVALGDVRAEDYLRRALALRERLARSSLEAAQGLNNLGIAVRARGDHAQARALYLRALEIHDRRAPGSLNVAATLNNLGLTERAAGDLSAAENYLTQSLRIKEKHIPNSVSVANTLNNLGNVARDRGNYALAHTYHSRALEIARQTPGAVVIADSYRELGLDARATGELRAARDWLERGLASREPLASDSIEVAVDLNHLGALALAERRSSEALGLFSRAVDIIEVQRARIQSLEARTSLVAEHAAAYAGLRATHVALGNIPAAFAVAERGRARSLLDSLTETRAEIRNGVDPELLARERSLQERLNLAAFRQRQVSAASHTKEQVEAANGDLEVVLAEVQELQALIRTKSPRYAALTQPQPLTLEDVQTRVLDGETLLLEYAFGDEVSHVFAITPSSVNVFALPGRAEIDRAARRVYDCLTARQPVSGETPITRRERIAKADADCADAVSALGHIVLDPVAGLLSNQRLLIVADGALQYIPFAMLPAPSRGAGAAATATPLIARHEIVNLPSASSLVVLGRTADVHGPASGLVAVVADPVFDEEDPRLVRARKADANAQTRMTLPADLTRSLGATRLVNERGMLSRLPFTREEADAILSFAPVDKTMKAFDFAANRSTVSGASLGRFRVVHLATHAVLSAEHPELSGIVLSLVDESGAPVDGFFRLHEVYNLNWPADLVVLSACQTAVGKDIRGEGLVSLTRGFMYAGAKSVLASLWSVNDSMTVQLMKEFYRGLLIKGLRPAAALRAAQIELLKRQASRAPYYWAGFVLQGQWR